MRSIGLKVVILAFISISLIKAQNKDSINALEELVITSFQKTIPVLENTSSVAKINQSLLKTNHPERLLEAINLIPGAKMEERSPGSYRLSMRGSTIRSPFGVRNVKIYLNDFILTDATGNSYLNLIEPSFVQSIEIMKGPQGGEIGAESGGVVVLNTFKKDELSLDLSSGSYQLFSQKLRFSKQLGKHHLQIGQSHYQTNSYREQSGVNKNAFFLNNDWNYHAKNKLNFLLLYTNLHYETPGGLTVQQMMQDRRSARLATNSLPSAVTQNAGIYNKTILGGISHQWIINDNWSQFSLIQASNTDFENPFISNYEFRKENNLQGRAYINHKKDWENISLQSRVGFEMGTQQSEVRNFDNNKGEAGLAQKFDDLKSHSAFYYFTQHLSISKKWFIDASISLNTMQYDWETIYPNPINGAIDIKKQWLPQLGVTYKVNDNFTIRGKVAKGASSPTTEEVRSSNQTIQTGLNAEYGWNKEVGIRKQFGSLFAEITAFSYHLKQAIVRRQDANGNDYFINAGGARQNGLEFTLESTGYNINSKAINRINFLISAHWYDFKYDDYKVGENDYTKKQLPGISKFSLQSTLGLDLFKIFKLNINHYYQSGMYLNDANTVKEDGFVIGNLTFSGRFNISKHQLSPYFGIHNIYYTKYSAGYDLNAFGNRFYNPAAEINYYLGLKFNW